MVAASGAFWLTWRAKPKMHIRVLLSKYRSYTPCPACAGARLQTREPAVAPGSRATANAVLHPAQRFMPWRGLDARAARATARPVPVST